MMGRSFRNGLKGNSSRDLRKIMVETANNQCRDDGPVRQCIATYANGVSIIQPRVRRASGVPWVRTSFPDVYPAGVASTAAADGTPLGFKRVGMNSTQGTPHSRRTLG